MASLSSPKKTVEPWWRDSVLFATELMGWIGGPIIIAVFLGHWLDQRYGTEPWLFLATVGAAFFISTIGIVRGAMREMRRLELLSKPPQPSAPIDSSDNSHVTK